MENGKKSIVKNLSGALIKSLVCLSGWKTDEKIVVIESDDWGSIRTASTEAFEYLQRLSYPMERSCYSYDALETDEDLDLLFDVLDRVRDCTGRPACMTANVVLANPDFAKIRATGWQYHYEPLHRTISYDPVRENIISSWNVGKANLLFVPQFHGREHICWWKWTNALRKGFPDASDTFALGMCGVPASVSPSGTSYFSPIFLHPTDIPGQMATLESMIKDGLTLFRRYLGYKSLSAIAPNVTWSEEAELVLAAEHVRYIQTGVRRIKAKAGRCRSKISFFGKRCGHGILCLVRNCNFEPAKKRSKPIWENTLREIEIAFKWRMPAVICSHRVNYVGSITPKFRDNSLKQLKQLLEAIIKYWPDVRFLSSPELGWFIEHQYPPWDQPSRFLERIFPR